MDCLFCQLVAKEINAMVEYENDELLACHDVNPQAPTHMLIIPKQHIATINDTDISNDWLLGRMILCAKSMAQKQSIAKDGYRLVFNVNHGGGQEVFHIHLHVLGGRQMNWPPG